MIEFIRVDAAPTDILENECIIYKPDFIEEIKKAKGKIGDKGLTTLSRLRNIFIEIGNNYSEVFSAYSHVNLSNFVGLAYETNEELSLIVCKIIDQQVPQVMKGMIDQQIREMKAGVTQVFFVSPGLEHTEVLSNCHIRMMDKKGQQAMMARLYGTKEMEGSTDTETNEDETETITTDETTTEETTEEVVENTEKPKNNSKKGKTKPKK